MLISLEGPTELTRPKEMLKGIDMDGSGEIDYTEFIAACLDKRVKQQEDMCWTAFRVFDTDGSGRISKQELHAMVSGADLSGAFSTATLEQLWKELIGEDLQAAGCRGRALESNA